MSNPFSYYRLNFKCVLSCGSTCSPVIRPGALPKTSYSAIVINAEGSFLDARAVYRAVAELDRRRQILLIRCPCSHLTGYIESRLMANSSLR